MPTLSVRINFNCNLFLHQKFLNISVKIDYVEDKYIKIVIFIHLLFLHKTKLVVLKFPRVYLKKLVISVLNLWGHSFFNFLFLNTWLLGQFRKVKFVCPKVCLINNLECYIKNTDFLMVVKITKRKL